MLIRMRMFFFAAILAALLSLPCTGFAQTEYFPKDYNECFLVYAKRSKTEAGAVLVRRMCRCRFQDASSGRCRRYSREAMDCIIANALNDKTETAVDGTDRACRKKHPGK